MITELKTKAEESLLRARMLLEQENEILPVVISTKEDLITADSIALRTPEDEKMITTMMVKHAKNGADAVVFIMDTFFREAKVSEEIDKENLDKDEEACEALVCLLFTTEHTFMKIWPYVKSENDRYTFMDGDWQECDKDRGEFKNPYTVA